MADDTATLLTHSFLPSFLYLHCCCLCCKIQGVTTRDYIVRPPELVKAQTIDIPNVAGALKFDVPDVSLRVLYRYISYDDEGNRIRSSPIWLNTTNADRHFRFSFMHRVIQEQDRLPRTITPLTIEDCNVGNVGQELCGSKTELVGKSIEGDYVRPRYEYLQVKLTKCVGDPECAPIEETNAILDSGEAQIQIQLKTQNFDIDQFHATGDGVVDTTMNWRLWGIKGTELKNDMYLQARRISQEERYAGSPPLPVTDTEILAFDRVESVMQPRPDDFFEIGSWYFRLSDSVQLENVKYWSTSILDLFGLWGAMASFLTSLSFGFVAFQYNRWMFNRHFSKSSKESRRIATAKAKVAMNMIVKSDKRSTDMYKSIRAQHDALVVEPDVRLFDEHHFDEVGRLSVTSEELRFPATAFGHLRKFAIQQHMRQYRAARTIGRWYVKRLIRHGKIQSSTRRLHLSRNLLRRSVTSGMFEQGNDSTDIGRSSILFHSTQKAIDEIRRIDSVDSLTACEANLTQTDSTYQSHQTKQQSEEASHLHIATVEK